MASSAFKTSEKMIIETDERHGVSGHQNAVRLMALLTTLATTRILKRRSGRSPSKPFLTSEHKMMTAIHSRKLCTIIPDHCLRRSKGSISMIYWIISCSDSCMTSPFSCSGLRCPPLFYRFHLPSLKVLGCPSWNLRHKLVGYIF